MTPRTASFAWPWWRLEPIAVVDQATRHHSVERRHDLPIGEQRLDPLQGRDGDVDLVGREGMVRFRNAKIRLGDLRAGAHLVERPVADKMSLRTQLLPASQQGVLKRYVCRVVIQLAAGEL